MQHNSCCPAGIPRDRYPVANRRQRRGHVDYRIATAQTEPDGVCARARATSIVVAVDIGRVNRLAQRAIAVGGFGIGRRVDENDAAVILAEGGGVGNTREGRRA